MGLFSKKQIQPSQPVHKDVGLTEVEYEEEPEAEIEVPKPIVSKQQTKKQVQQPSDEVDEYDEVAEEPGEVLEETKETSSDSEILAAIQQNFNDIFDRLVEINVRLEKLEAAAFRGR